DPPRLSQDRLKGNRPATLCAHRAMGCGHSTRDNCASGTEPVNSANASGRLNRNRTFILLSSSGVSLFPLPDLAACPERPARGILPCVSSTRLPVLSPCQAL